jgi:RNA polymerase sigma factor (sigma-70 family)
MTLNAPSARFPTTAWTCVEKAKDPNHPDFVAAMNRLITSYWKPVYYFLRAKKWSAEQAEDLVQEFFVRFLVKDWLRRADPKRGRFRNFLLRILTRFVYGRTVDGQVQKKFEEQFVSVRTLVRDEDRTWEPPAGQTPEQVFHHRWQLETRATVRCNLEAYYVGVGKPDCCKIFAAYHFAERSEDQPTQQELARRFNLTRDQVAGILREAKKRYERLLRQELRDQGCPEEELDQDTLDLL